MAHSNSELASDEKHIKNHPTDFDKSLIACEECDTIYRKSPLSNNERAYCNACGSELYRNIPSFNTLFALVLTALIIFIIANSFSIVQVELQGIYSQTTLLGTAWAMFEADRAFVGFLILMTTFVVPLFYLLLLSYVISMVILKKNNDVGFSDNLLIYALRTLYQIRTWGMIEVFLIGVLVTLVKLVGMVVVIPGIALWAFAILSLLLVYLVSFKVKDLWDAIDEYLIK